MPPTVIGKSQPVVNAAGLKRARWTPVGGGSRVKANAASRRTAGEEPEEECWDAAVRFLEDDAGRIPPGEARHGTHPTTKRKPLWDVASSGESAEDVNLGPAKTHFKGGHQAHLAAHAPDPAEKSSPAKVLHHRWHSRLRRPNRGAYPWRAIARRNPWILWRLPSRA